MRIPNDLNKSVVFILCEEKKDKWNFVGTGFLVSKKLKKIPGRSFVYLVTAKHVVIALKNKRFAIRLNKKSGGSELFVGTTNDHCWYDHPMHEEDPVDISVIRMPSIPTGHLDFMTIPMEMILKKEEMQADIGTGDEVFIIGLFAKLSGNERNIPIVRAGNIAMIPEEKVSTKKFGDMEAYLIEARSLGGISGSPVFTTPSGIIGKKRLYLMGLVHGHWDVPVKIREKMAPQDKKNGEEVDAIERNFDVNMGIAIVVPGFKIRETIEHPELIAHARAEEEKMLKEV